MGQEIVGCEINDTQAIRFLKATKLEFNFLEKVSESERERVQLPSEIEFQILDHESEKETVVDHTCQSQLINLSRISRKRKTGLKNLYLIDDQD